VASTVVFRIARWCRLRNADDASDALSYGETEEGCSAVDNHRVYRKGRASTRKSRQAGKIAVADCQSSGRKGSLAILVVAPRAYEILRLYPGSPVTCGHGREGKSE